MIPERVFNRLLYDKGQIAAEIQPTIAGCRRWIAIYPTKESHPLDELQKMMSKHAYSIVDFELKEELIDANYRSEDMLNRKRYYFNSLSELNSFLITMAIDLTRFTFPWRCDYPL